MFVGTTPIPIFPLVSIVITVPVPSLSVSNKYLLDCWFINDQLPVLQNNSKVASFAFPFTFKLIPVVTFPAKVVSPLSAIVTKVAPLFAE